MNEKYMDFYTKAEIDAMLNGLSFTKISRTAFDTLSEKDGNTVYYVYDENGKITQYLGETELKSGSVTAGISALVTVGTSGSSQGLTPTE